MGVIYSRPAGFLVSSQVVTQFYRRLSPRGVLVFDNSIRVLCVALLIASSISACGEKCHKEHVAPVEAAAVQAESPPAVAAQAPPAGVFATVDGVPITEVDIRFALKLKDESPLLAADRDKVLKALIHKQVLANAAAKVGLDAKADYQHRLQREKAVLDAFKRDTLATSFFKQHVVAKSEPDEAAVRKYFDENAARIRSELHVLQILSRNETEILEMKKLLDGGAAFAEVASSQFRKLPAGASKPWDLGYLKYKQVPSEWRSVVKDMKIGDTSDIIRGGAKRFWIIKLLAKRDNPKLDFDGVKDIIKSDLRDATVATRGDQIIAEVRKAAKIVRLPPPPAD